MSGGAPASNTPNLKTNTIQPAESAAQTLARDAVVSQCNKRIFNQFIDGECGGCAIVRCVAALSQSYAEEGRLGVVG